VITRMPAHVLPRGRAHAYSEYPQRGVVYR